jgi:HD-like signal output (HDOD) protein
VKPAAEVGAPTRVEILQQLKPVMSRSEMQERIKACGELRALSPALANVLKLVRTPSVSTDAIAAAVRCDHAIALKVIKLANSSVYTRGDPVTSVKAAVVRLGLEQVMHAVVNIAVIERFGSVGSDEFMTCGRFWQHSIAAGVIACELARARNPAGAESAFTLGLLHDVGRVIMSEALGSTYLDVLKTARANVLPLEQVEKRMLLMTHADIMEDMLRAWHLPRDLAEPIALHQLSAGGIRQATPRIEAAMTVALADRLAHAMLLGCSGNRAVYAIDEFCEALRVDAGTIERIEGMVEEATDDIRFAMLAGPNPIDVKPLTRELVQCLPTPPKILFVGAVPRLDAFRMVCDRLSDSSAPAPNLAVVHLRHVREKGALCKQLTAAEEAAGVKELPTIVISPTGGLDGPGPATRRTALLGEPLVLDSFLDAARSLLSAPLTAEAA